jgi:hypothetical protein
MQEADRLRDHQSRSSPKSSGAEDLSEKAEIIRMQVQMQRQMEEMQLMHADNERLTRENAHKGEQLQGMEQLVRQLTESQHKLLVSRGWQRVQELEGQLQQMEDVQVIQAEQLAQYQRQISALKAASPRSRLDHRPRTSKKEKDDCGRQLHILMRPGARGARGGCAGGKPWLESKRAPGIADTNDQHGLFA